MNTNEDDILQLQLNDTFYDWYLRTNQVIEYINPINVYDVFPGVGLVESRSGNPGTVELSISTNSALYGIGTLNTGGIHDVVLTYATLSAGTVTNTSLFAFQGGANQLFKVAASDILPPTVNGNHIFTGDITFEQDLNIFGPTITLNTNGGSRDNCGIVVESTADTQIQNVLWTFDTATTAWMSSENLGLKTGKAFVTDSYPKAEFPFEASQSQGQVDLQLATTSGGIPERFSIEAQFDTANSLSFSHYYNNILVNDILELSSSGAGGEVIVKNTITITDVLHSTPFAQTPTATSVPITGIDGYLSQFVNRVTLPTVDTSVGDFVYMNGGQARRASPDTLVESQSIGIVESISGGNAVIIMTGAFSGILSGLTPGSKYYLDPVTPGGVTNLNPDNTNGVLDKPVFIATSATSGIIIPDFTTTGSGSITTTTTTSSGTQDTFKTIEITGSSSVVADSSNDILTFTAGANITLTGNSGADAVTFACKIPESATNHTLLFGTGVALYDYTTAINTFSLVGRAVDGNIAGIVIAPGTIVGRIDDSNDSDNAVKGLTGAEVRNIIGLPENSSYIQTVSFEAGSGFPVHVHDATSDGETLTIGAGSNITFSYSGGTLFIHGESGGGGGGGGSTDGSTILVGLERDNPVVLTELLFENDFGGANTAREQFIEFEFRDNLGGTGFVSAKPTNNYLKLYADTVLGSHTAGNTLRIQGGASISSNLKTTTGYETFVLDLDETIYVQKIIASPLSTDKNGLILSGGDDSGRNTIKILDDTRPTTGQAGLNQSTLIINAWDEVDDANILRKSTRSLGGIYATKCVSMFADSGYDDGTGGGLPSLYSYPIRMHELVVDKIICANLVAQEATKVNETINKIMGGINDTAYFIGEGSTKLEFITNDDYISKGILFEFTDSEDGLTTKNAFIFSPAKDYAATIDTADYRQFVVGGSLRFAEVIADTGDYTTWSPTLSHSSTSGLLCKSFQTTSELKFTANNTGTATIGVQTNGTSTSAYTYLTHTHGSTSHLRITALAEIQATSFTIKTVAGVGYKFEPVNTGQNTIAAGHVLYVDAVTGSIGTIKSRFIIKPYSAGGGVDTTDPINTLYYTT